MRSSRDHHHAVRQAEDGMRVEPDHIYVIPPNRDTTINHWVLHLKDREAHRGEYDDRHVSEIASGFARQRRDWRGPRRDRLLTEHWDWQR